MVSILQYFRKKFKDIEYFSGMAWRFKFKYKKKWFQFYRIVFIITKKQNINKIKIQKGSVIILKI